jgi:DEAD/DEAH box helicase domain-containing protein
MPDTRQVLEELSRDQDFMSCVAHWETIPAREGIFVPFPEDTDPRIVSALRARGIERLYSHQAESYEAVRKGRNVVVVTPTASGKTLCYNLPVLTGLLERREARALYLFPTKALSFDQQAELNEVILDGIPVKVSTYDGDTPSSVRVSARESGRIVISNPDMLHSGILPNHPKWIKFLSNLSYVVIDEIHTYRGVFGSHMANLIRRLKRVARFYGGNPVFIALSATIGNPLELAVNIIGEDALLVDTNGAPSGEKHIVLYNPPLVDPVQGIRRGVVLESQKIALNLLRKGVKTIVFARSRVGTELIATYIRKSLENLFTDNERIRVESYRGGYLPRERREIELGLRDGSIRGVVSTNALELGIDIGGLDAAVLAGFPGSIASSWQQAGRAGRRSAVSLAVMVASSSPVDQYLIKHAPYFFGRSPESGFIDSRNLYILLDHLKCAAYELPFARGEDFGGDVGELLGYLEEEGVVRLSEGSYYWSDRSYPAEQVSLRSASAENIVIIDTTKGRHTVIGEMDRPSAKELLFENAVYLHRGEQFMVTKLDLENRTCFVEESNVNYYTDSIVKTDIKLLSRDGEEGVSNARILSGDVLVRSQVTKYKKLKFFSHESIGYGDIFLPEEEMHTRSAVILLSPDLPSGAAFVRISPQLREEAIARVGSLVQHVAPVFLLCDRRDIGVAERLKDPETLLPSIFVYDMYPGGTGLADGFRAKAKEILAAALDLITNCPCESGCPSCMGPDDRKDPEENLKAVVEDFLASWLEA